MSTYHVFQPGSLGSPESGCVLAVREGFGALLNETRLLGSGASGEGRGVRERSILRGRVYSAGATGSQDVSFGAAAGHAPPSWAPRARAAYLKAFAKVKAKFKGGDLNVVKRVAHRLLNRRVLGGGVLWLVMPRRGWSVTGWRMVDVTGDHKAVFVSAKNKRTGRTVRFLVINCMSVSTGPTHAANIFKHGLNLNPDVVMASECADFRASKI